MHFVDDNNFPGKAEMAKLNVSHFQSSHKELVYRPNDERRQEAPLPTAEPLVRNHILLGA